MIQNQLHYERIEPALEIMNIRTAADLYEEQAIQHQRHASTHQKEVIRLNRLARHAREMANKLEGTQV